MLTHSRTSFFLSIIKPQPGRSGLHSIGISGLQCTCAGISGLHGIYPIL